MMENLWPTLFRFRLSRFWLFVDPNLTRKDNRGYRTTSLFDRVFLRYKKGINALAVCRLIWKFEIINYFYFSLKP